MSRLARPRAGLAVLLILAGAACGRKGAPLPPIIPIPAAVDRMTAERVGRDVYLTFTVPGANVDRSEPVDIDRVEVYAVTASTPPAPGRTLDGATRVATLTIPPESQLPGSRATVAEALPDSALATAPGAANAPPLHRYYVAVPFSSRNQAGPESALVDLPLVALPAPPAGVAVNVGPAAAAITWAPAASPAGSGMTRYNVYVASRDATSPPPSARPVPLNPMPLTVATFMDDGIEFGRERCYVVRTVRTEGTNTLEGDASTPACVTPVDTFPPAAPERLIAVADAGAITLIWEPNSEPDLAGYRILRGTAGDATLQPLTAAPVTEARFIDTTVRPGTRYVYAVQAVDTAMPPNVSPESNRAEETAR